MFPEDICLKKNWCETIENVAIPVALGVNDDGNREEMTEYFRFSGADGADEKLDSGTEPLVFFDIPA